MSTISTTLDSKTGAALVASATRSSFLWGRSAAGSERLPLFGFRVDNTALQDAAESLVSDAARGLRRRVAFLNAYVINTAARDPAYARVLDGADRLFADGSGMALAARLAGKRLIDNVNGTDMCPLLCRAAIRAGQTIFFLGGAPGVAEQARATLAGMGLGAAIAGTHHGYVKRGGDEETAAVAAINASGASILLVGMGVPIQDIWIARNFNRLNTPVAIGVGGLFDFFAGRVSRAPAALRGHGLEWVWRLAQEPGRMWRRYLVGNCAFMARAAGEALAERLGLTDNGVDWGARVSRWLALGRVRVAPGLRASGKRAFDFAGALGLSIALSVPMLMIAALIKLDSPGPVFFRQKRVGLNGRVFDIWKFRSMRVDADRMHAALSANDGDRRKLRFKARQDPRVTAVGRFIRKTSLDELPQLWNVLRGDMSLVGPRPALPSEVACYTLSDRDRLLARPGITCTWQVNGRADIDFVGQVELDREYVRNASFFGDMWLLIRTVPAVVLGRGAY